MGEAGEGKDEEKCPYEGGERCPIMPSACAYCGRLTPWRMLLANGSELHFCGVACVLAMEDFLQFAREKPAKENEDVVSRGTDLDRAPPDGS